MSESRGLFRSLVGAHGSLRMGNPDTPCVPLCEATSARRPRCFCWLFCRSPAPGAASGACAPDRTSAGASRGPEHFDGPSGARAPRGVEGLSARGRVGTERLRGGVGGAVAHGRGACHYDVGVIHPAKVGGWGAEVRLSLRWHRSIVSSVWLDPKSAPEETIRGQGSGRAGAGDWGDGGMLGARDFCAREQARLGDEFQRMHNGRHEIHRLGPGQRASRAMGFWREPSSGVGVFICVWGRPWASHLCVS